MSSILNTTSGIEAFLVSMAREKSPAQTITRPTATMEVFPDTCS